MQISKKRIISIMLSSILSLSLFAVIPLDSYADDNVYEVNIATDLDSGDLTITSETLQGYSSVRIYGSKEISNHIVVSGISAPLTIILDEINFKSTVNQLLLQNIEDLTIVLKGTSTMTTRFACFDLNNASANISGPGSLNCISTGNQTNFGAVNATNSSKLHITDSANVTLHSQSTAGDATVYGNTPGQSQIQVDGGAVLALGGHGIAIDYTTSFENCTITGDGAVAQGIDGVYDADGYRPHDTTPTIGVQDNEDTEIPWDGTRTLEITNTSDYASPAYQWYKNGAAIANETGGALTVSEAGEYKLRVVESDRSAHSAAITLTKEAEIAAPQLQVREGSTTIPHDSSLTLEVANAADYNSPVLVWEKDGGTVSGSGSTYTATEAGSYKVKVTADGQTKEARLTLTKEAPPPTSYPSVSDTDISLDVYNNQSKQVTISLGMSGDNATPLADKATATVNGSAVSIDKTEFSAVGVLTVTAEEEGTAIIDVVFEGVSGYDDTLTVNVTDSTPQATYTVIFDPAGGSRTGGGELTQTVEEGKAATSPTVTRGGYTFAGWDRDFSNVTADMTVTARWTLQSGGYTPSRDSDSGGSSGGTSTADSVKVAPTTYTITIGTAEMQKLIATTKTNGWDYVRHFGNLPTTVKAEAWKLLDGYKFVARTTGSPVQVQLTFPEPTRITADMQVSGAVKGTIVDNRKAFFEKWFTNEVRVVHLEHAGGFGQAVEVAALVDLAGMDTAKLVLYSYDKASNSYKQIENSNALVDKNGYLHFTTGLAGDIVISEGSIEKR